jgi:hypothetical protein
MAAGNLNVGHQSPQASLPPLSQKKINTFTWGNGGNSVTIIDEYIHPNSQVDAWVTGSVPQQGQWAYAVTQGQVVITSSSSESSTLPVSYVVY